jgi:hypothetical protein
MWSITLHAINSSVINMIGLQEVFKMAVDILHLFYLFIEHYETALE